MFWFVFVDWFVGCFLMAFCYFLLVFVFWIVFLGQLFRAYLYCFQCILKFVQIYLFQLL